MNDVIVFFQGKRTYLIAFVGSALALVMAVWPDFSIPEYVWVLLNFLGLGALRAGMPAAPKP